MGQYYRPCLLSPDYKIVKRPVLGAVDCHILGNGAKLMEHSYVGNIFVIAATQMLRDNNTHPFVWCGNYAEPVNEFLHGTNTMYDYACKDDLDTKYTILNFSDLIHFAEQYNLSKKSWREFLNNHLDRYVINHTRKEYVAVPSYNTGKPTIHPLPLLTADGNGSGGGDYSGTDMSKVGIWAYNVIESANQVPEGYRELKVNFKEE